MRVRQALWAGVRNEGGLSLIEVMLATALMATLSALAFPAYMDQRERGRQAEAATTIAAMSLDIQRYHKLNGRYPNSLAEAGIDGQIDPWGFGYRYYRIAGSRNPSGARMDRFLVPINSDFDLYSIGPDGDTKRALTPPVSHDDIIRANDGHFVGVALDF